MSGAWPSEQGRGTATNRDGSRPRCRRGHSARGQAPAHARTSAHLATEEMRTAQPTMKPAAACVPIGKTVAHRRR